MKVRKLKEHERNLLKYLLKNSGYESSYSITELVEDLDDGNMGSIRFISSETGRVYYADLLQVNYTDEDNVPVIITLILDNFKNLYELEFWKVNFNKLLRYPKPEEVLFRSK